KNNHLPGVKSAAEVAAQGGSISVGESYTKLLEKVEELTLYTIAQQKEIDELKKMVKISKQ
ncbi:MAG: hypothetical protein JXQ23_08645, partial [Clostridia bacterium]|nr:hypothetical protein [Clostridia bacterium]